MRHWGWNKSTVGRAIAVEASGESICSVPSNLAADEDLAIGLQGNRRNVDVAQASGWIETGVAAAVGIEPGNTCARKTFDGGEIPPDQHLSVRLHCDGVHRAIDARARIEGEVHVSRRAARVK